ncbi:hypothetical protein ACR8G9_22850, partial [Salmonella enterica subsp. enterica serovar Paratyphi A]
AIPLDETKGSLVGPSDRMETDEIVNTVGFAGVNFGSNISNGSGSHNVGDVKRSVDDDSATTFSPLTSDSSNLGAFQEFPRPPFDDSDTSFSYLLSGSFNYARKNGGECGSNDLE